MNHPEAWGGEIDIKAGMFVLDGHQVIPCTNILEWGRMMESKDRIVAQEHIGNAFISTVFLGVDHGWGPCSEGLVFETMVFDSPDGDDRTTRYRTWDEAEAGHKKMVEEIKAL